jgi:tetratricopeptide (TPR) repeat protein
VARGTAVARELAARAIALHACGAFARCEDRLLKDKFLFAQWRLARMAALRDENAGAGGDIVQARQEAALAEKLDDLNPELRRLNDAISWIRSRDGNTLTPREGLRIALERADFALARRYATPILSADDKHPDANFGMGMSYFVEGRYAEAEKYMKVALETRPDEPALLNNLAICCYRQSRFNEALAYAEKALAKLPDAPAVRKTYEQIRKTIEEKKEAPAGAK